MERCSWVGAGAPQQLGAQHSKLSGPLKICQGLDGSRTQDRQTEGAVVDGLPSAGQDGRLDI